MNQPLSAQSIFPDANLEGLSAKDLARIGPMMETLNKRQEGKINGIASQISTLAAHWQTLSTLDQQMTDAGMDQIAASLQDPMFKQMLENEILVSAGALEMRSGPSIRRGSTPSEASPMADTLTERMSQLVSPQISNPSGSYIRRDFEATAPSVFPAFNAVANIITGGQLPALGTNATPENMLRASMRKTQGQDYREDTPIHPDHYVTIAANDEIMSLARWVRVGLQSRNQHEQTNPGASAQDLDKAFRAGFIHAACDLEAPGAPPQATDKDLPCEPALRQALADPSAPLAQAAAKIGTIIGSLEEQKAQALAQPSVCAQDAVDEIRRLNLEAEQEAAQAAAAQAIQTAHEASLEQALADLRTREANKRATQASAPDPGLVKRILSRFGNSLQGRRAEEAPRPGAGNKHGR